MRFIEYLMSSISETYKELRDIEEDIIEEETPELDELLDIEIGMYVPSER